MSILRKVNNKNNNLIALSHVSDCLFFFFNGNYKVGNNEAEPGLGVGVTQRWGRKMVLAASPAEAGSEPVSPVNIWAGVRAQGHRGEWHKGHGGEGHKQHGGEGSMGHIFTSWLESLPKAQTSSLPKKLMTASEISLFSTDQISQYCKH